MLNLKAVLAKDIAVGVKEAFGLEDVEIVVERAGNPEHGDYASPVALLLTKELKKKPLELAEELLQAMPKKEYIGKLEVAAPGFLNIRINPGWLTARLDDVVEQDVCSDINIGGGESFNFEFISANPTGPLHFGNARTAFSVDTLANVLSCAGYTVSREYYVNDAGGQIKKLGESVVRKILQAADSKVDYPEEMYQGEYVADLAQAVAEYWKENEGKEFSEEDLKSEEVLQAIGKQAAADILAGIKKTIKEDLKIDFDIWSSEEEIRKSGEVEKTVAELKKTGKTYEKDDALYLKTTEFGDSDDRVLVKSDGEFAYIMPDIAYHRDKYNREYDHIFTVVGADHQGHAPKLYAALEILGYDISRLKVMAAQWMRFMSDGKPVKLSKRAGQIFTPKDLIDEVGYDAARFFMVQHALTTHMDFDLDLAKERSERNPVYYIQYAYVRMQSILRKAKQAGFITEIGNSIPLTSDANLTDTTEVNLMKKIHHLPETISDICSTLEVQQLTTYAHELAKTVHAFYQHVPVIADDIDKKVVMGRLQLVLAASKTLAKTLDLLGISKPDVM